MSAAELPAPVTTRPVGGGRRRPRAIVVFVTLTVLLLAIALLAATIGAAGIPLSRLWPALGLGAPADPATFARDQLVLWSIRIPRIAISAMIGALLAVSGTIMQGLFRNPLADPALVGVSSGGALAAAFTIVILDNAIAPNAAARAFELLPLSAFFGSLVTTLLLYRISSREGRTSVAIFLLSGLAIAALANAGIGLLIFMADDRQLRDITFWLLGSLGGATWSKATLLLPFLAASAAVMPFIARGLDVLVLGESEAFHSGINVERLKIICIVLVSAMTGAAVAICGVIGFIGIVVPHLLRLAIGPGHRMLLPASALFGAALLAFADTFARVLAAPAEIPVGILTATIGAPFFLYVLLRQRALVGS
ncbi:iron chelate uptake ABC transporter family permease subunit [Bradyrhizobium sp. LHD-71]|uniref:FecCD family ABC transporter permease n=1 Tax=Bradyrhizobium sp. LHD-71 TaxID=3072141 RepID=UPI00280D689C|nr:iron chelate uptake ABC transporter family permease subunit [Bradyrhizobium sp. LHD-71]MDQ8730935.1 iron chelate uptake ABC transporter family permease subunit [Bradyrhizobium sp. LHD-71]